MSTKPETTGTNLGRVAYEADSVETHLPWESLSPGARRVWGATAAAVRAEVERGYADLLDSACRVTQNGFPDDKGELYVVPWHEIDGLTGALAALKGETT